MRKSLLVIHLVLLFTTPLWALTTDEYINLTANIPEKKMRDMRANTYQRFTFEVTSNGEKWLGFKQRGMKIFVPAADLQEI